VWGEGDKEDKGDKGEKEVWEVWEVWEDKETRGRGDVGMGRRECGKTRGTRKNLLMTND